MTEPKGQRDPRLDFFRGLGMFIILIAHITGNPWTLWIPARFGFSDATEMFVFCSGMASALAFGVVFSRAGWLMGTLQIANRIWQVYWVHLGVFFVTLGLMLALNATGAFPRDEVGALNLYPFLNNTGPNLLGLLTLTYVPNYFDILPMYLVILALIPAMMALVRIDLRLAILFSLTLWVAASVGLNLPAEAWFSKPSERGWFFNPFSWQLVFFTGFALMAGWLPSPPVHRVLVGISIAILVLSIPFSWHKIIGASEVLRDWRREWSILFDKTDFGILRYIHFLALAYLAWVVAGPGGARLRHGGRVGAVVAVIMQVGQQSLAVFAASMVMARVLGAILKLAGGGMMAALAVNLAGFAIIIAVARLSAFFKARPWKTPRPQPAEVPLDLPTRQPVPVKMRS
ncbi:OpgC domain-containing protein [Aliigemmobacter aestuarii]|uniref:OpgC domain-containing protein n=1 Tax=Aliigemmobacter aestuarii TaxID=1445661 RepID=A0A4S3MQI5_9RHOB|nr:OpgC domain-containing protein [Gemmobacter aestuarii]THD84667.1 OpgC domain-containing protein [Gemmobacter aestuarii]